MPDAPDRPVPRFPPQNEAAVCAAIDRLLARVDARTGFASAAGGGDILFLEALLARGGAIHVVLPFDADTFAAGSVSPGWRPRFDAVLARAAQVIVSAPPGYRRRAEAYDHANHVLHEMALAHAPLTGLALWDGRPGGRGGTASAVDRWRRSGLTVEIIDPLDPAR